MKKLLLFLAAASLLACKPQNAPEEPKKPIGKLDPNATITIRPAKGVQIRKQSFGVQTRSKATGLTALEVVQQATSIHYQSHYADNRYHEELVSLRRGFREDMKDFTTPALKMLSLDVITYDGKYFRDLTYSKNVYIVKVTDGHKVDTIACIPDEVINAARPLIEAAYNDSNYTEVYRLFDEAFTFRPL